MKAKNCIKGVKVKTKVDYGKLYYIGSVSKNKYHLWGDDVPKGSVGIVTTNYPDSDGDVTVSFSNKTVIIVNAKCLSKVKE